MMDVEGMSMGELNIVTLCTGNVARSVMLGYMLTTMSDDSGYGWKVRSAGTHVMEGAAMSGRTRDALLAIPELGSHHYNGHRSRQLVEYDVSWAHVVFATEADHVRYVSRHFPAGASRTVLLGQFIRYAPLDAPLDAQLAAVAALEPDAAFDVADPAGGDQAVYDACAKKLWNLAHAVTVLVGTD